MVSSMPAGQHWLRNRGHRPHQVEFQLRRPLALLLVVSSLALTGAACAGAPRQDNRGTPLTGPATQNVLGPLTSISATHLALRDATGQHDFIVNDKTVTDGVLGAPSYMRPQNHAVQLLPLGLTASVSARYYAHGSVTATWSTIYPRLWQSARVSA